MYQRLKVKRVSTYIYCKKVLIKYMQMQDIYEFFLLEINLVVIKLTNYTSLQVIIMMGISQFVGQQVTTTCIYTPQFFSVRIRILSCKNT